MGLKEGDKLYCHTTGTMSCGELFAVKGEHYTISSMGDNGNIHIKTMISDNHYWGCLNARRDKEDFERFFSLGGPLHIFNRMKRHKL